jgi:hypothetical protein
LKVHIWSELLSLDPEEPPQAASGVSEMTVATAAAVSLVFEVLGRNPVKGMRMAPAYCSIVQKTE